MSRFPNRPSRSLTQAAALGVLAAFASANSLDAQSSTRGAVAASAPAPRGVAPGPAFTAHVPPVTSRLSLDAAGHEVSQGGGSPALSADGRWLAFTSASADLVERDANGVADVFVRDLVTGAVELVSVSSLGDPANAASTGRPALSADGRFVLFESHASNLVPNDTNSSTDVFRHDRLTGVTLRVSVASDGSQAGGTSWGAVMSGDGGEVAFVSVASDLVDGDTNFQSDVFWHDVASGDTLRVSVSSEGEEADDFSHSPAISADGGTVSFFSWATNLDPGDTSYYDVFVHDLEAATTLRGSVGDEGQLGNWDAGHTSSLSPDGRFLAFSSLADNLVPDDHNWREDVFVRDLWTGETTMVSVSSEGEHGNMTSVDPSISADGRYVAFTSLASNLVPGDLWFTSDVFVHDRVTKRTVCASLALDGTTGSGPSEHPVLSPDGSRVVFGSLADDLVPADGNASSDVFQRSPLF